LAIPVLVMSITSFITGRLVKKQVYLMKNLTWIGLTISGAGLLSLGLIKTTWYLFLAVSIVGLGNGLALPSLNYLITSSTSDEKRGIITSSYGAVRFFGVALGPPLFGIGLEWSKVGLFVVAGILGLASAALVLIFIDPKRLVTEDSVA
ncbi:MAG: MFS transporter, partial [Firmicutes bacterium]|nr:MFS transporter [Bacillota bacterium]